MLARLSAVTKTYRLGETSLQALRGIDFELAEGEVCAVMGPSGSGKTTLLNILGCLDLPTSGEYHLAGRRIVARDFDDLAEIRSREIGFVFQSFNLVPVLDVRENIELAMLCANRSSAAERARRIDRLIDAVGLGPYCHHRPFQLSGGQQQRAALARALAAAPRLILADEPTANLDSESATTILELLLEMNRTEGVTLLFSTHDPRVLAYARRKVELCDGAIREDWRARVRQVSACP